jgi:hypothetical protein
MNSDILPKLHDRFHGVLGKHGWQLAPSKDENENHRPDPSKLKPRMARHWSDVAVMSTAKRFADEKLSLDLLAQVIRFKKIFRMDARKQQPLNHSAASRIARHFRGSVTDFATWF